MKTLVAIILIVVSIQSFAELNFNRCRTLDYYGSLVQIHSYDQDNRNIEFFAYQNMDQSLELSSALSKVGLIKPFEQVRSFQLSSLKCSSKNPLEFSCNNLGYNHIGMSIRHRDTTGVFHEKFLEKNVYTEVTLAPTGDHYQLSLVFQTNEKYANANIALNCK